MLVNVNGVQVDISTLKKVDEVIMYSPPSFLMSLKNAISSRLASVKFRNVETDQMEFALNELNASLS